MKPKNLHHWKQPKKKSQPYTKKRKLEKTPLGAHLAFSLVA
jgi:hypothetical protein